jgi:hypothetical protein
MLHLAIANAFGLSDLLPLKKATSGHVSLKTDVSDADQTLGIVKDSDSCSEYVGFSALYLCDGCSSNGLVVMNKEARSETPSQAQYQQLNSQQGFRKLTKKLDKLI